MCKVGTLSSMVQVSICGVRYTCRQLTHTDSRQPNDVLEVWLLSLSVCLCQQKSRQTRDFQLTRLKIIMMSFSDCTHAHTQTNTLAMHLYMCTSYLHLHTHRHTKAIILTFYFIVYTQLHGYSLRKSTLHLSFERKHFFLRWNYPSKLREWLLTCGLPSGNPVLTYEWETENVESLSNKTSLSYKLGYSVVCFTVHYCKFDISHRLHRFTDKNSYLWDEWHELPCEMVSLKRVKNFQTKFEIFGLKAFMNVHSHG